MYLEVVLGEGDVPLSSRIEVSERGRGGVGRVEAVIRRGDRVFVMLDYHFRFFHSLLSSISLALFPFLLI